MTNSFVPGSHYRKVDLHMHTPQSKDYKVPDATPADIVNAAISVGLDAIAVTDHNDYRYVDLVKKAAKDTQLTIFPGVEISTRDGHLIALLDPRSSGKDLHTLLIDCGLKKDDEYGEQETICMLPIEEAAKKVNDAGGIAIAAHVDAPKGFLKTVGVGQARKRIYEDRNIMGLEIVDSSNKNDWLEGRIYPQVRACIQGSDSHSIDTIGSRFTWVRVANLNVAGLRQALKDPKARIRFSDEFDPNLGRNYIESLHISQGFFGKQDIVFNPGLNCIIGGQGVGKSALIEFVRFALGCASRVDPIEKDHQGKLDTLLGHGGTATVVFRKTDKTRYSITRMYDGEANPVTIRKLTEDGDDIEYPLPDLQRYFQVLAYSQNEAISVARDSVRQLDLIDAHLDMSSEQSKLYDLEQKLQDNTDALMQLDRNAVDLEDLISRSDMQDKQIKADEQRLVAIEETKKNPAIRDHQAWLDEERFLDSLREAREQVKDSLTRAISNIDVDSLDIAPHKSTLGHDDELKKVWEINQKIKSYIEDLGQQVEDKFEEIRQNSQSAAPNWITAYRAHKKAYAEVSEKLGNVQINALQTNLQRNKKLLEKLQTQIRNEKQKNNRKMKLIESRNLTLNQIESERQRISQKRDRQAKAMSKTLKKRVLVSVTASGNKRAFSKWLSENFDGRSVKNHHIEKIVSACSPRELAEMVRKNNDNNAQALMKKFTISSTAADSILMTLKQNTSLLYKLEHIVLEDLPDIRMKLKNGDFKKLDELSTGQKFTVIILLALTDDDKPIVYDQPEDAIEAALIFSDIAQLLRHAKDYRQFIFATHNPNMSVAADLDLAIVVSGSAKDATVDQAGGIEDPNIRGSLIEYLEGGKEAMAHRIGKYEN